MKKIVTTHKIPSTRQYVALVGRFGHGAVKIPYLVLNMSLHDAARDLLLPEEAAEGSLEGIDLEALYQRELDWRRVNHGLLKYLQDGTQAQFFNALTVVAQPTVDNRPVSFSSQELQAPNDDAEAKQVGPIAFIPQDGNPLNSTTVTLIQWNPEQLKAIAIDGQHRIAALKTLIKQKRNDSSLTSSTVSVIIVVPAAELGYDNTSTVDSQIRLMRKLFTDLNSHSRVIHRARLILLEDRDPTALFVRRLLGKTLQPTDSEWWSDGADRIPLTLVDWHSEDNKVDGGPYITSVLLLDDIVQILTDLRPIGSWSDAAQVRQQRTCLRELGWVESKESADLFERTSKESFASFSYPDEDLLSAAEAFATKWAVPVVRLFGSSAPIEQLLRARAQMKMLSPAFSTWYPVAIANKRMRTSESLLNLTKTTEGLLSSNDVTADDVALWNQWIGDELDDSVNVVKRAKAGLFFKVVFQKALFIALKSMDSVPPVPEDGDESPPENSANFWSDSLARLVNRLHALKLLDERAKMPGSKGALLWAGTFVDPSTHNMDVSGAKRGAQWLRLLALTMHAAEFEEFGRGGNVLSALKSRSDSKKRVADFLEACKQVSPDLELHARALVDGLGSPTPQRVDRAMHRVVAARGVDMTSTDLKNECLQEFGVRFFGTMSLLVDTN